MNLSLSDKQKFQLKTISSFLALLVFYWLTESGQLLYECKVLIRYQENYLKPAFYLFNFLLAVYSLNVLLSSLQKWAYVLAMIFAIGAFGINYIYVGLNNIGFDYEDLLLVKQNIHFGYEESIFATYGNVFLSTIITALGLTFLLVTLKRIRTRNGNPLKWSLLALISFILSYGIIDYSNAQKTSIPSFMKLPALLLYDAINPIYTGNRDQPFLEPEEQSSFDHIVWIVDESVRGDHLQLNNPLIKTTPYLNAIEEKSIINFGIANSAAVCSDYSHAVLMTGTRLSDLPDKENKILSSPTIFQYAKGAGFEPALIYSPGYEDKPKSYLTMDDFNTIKIRYNTKMSNPDLTYYEWDFKSIDYLKEIVNTNQKSFTYFLKYGAHFHYDDSYPSDHTVFSPTMGFRNFEAMDSVRLTNSYHNAIRWTVDSFFKELIESVGDKNVLFIYTSDHGQNLTEFPEIKLTHCVRKNAPNVMANVPLFILSTNYTKIEEWKSSSKARDHKSHFNIFPTTLECMGYKKDQIEPIYGKGLFDFQNESFYTSGDIFGRARMYSYKFSTKASR